MNTLAPVSEIMTINVLTVSPKDSLDNVANIFATHNIHHIPVVEEGKVVGMVSKLDFYKATPFYNTSEHQLNIYLERKSVADIMTRKIATVHKDERIDVAALIFNENRFHALPIVNDYKELLGIVTPHDLIRYCFPITEKAWV